MLPSAYENGTLDLTVYDARSPPSIITRDDSPRERNKADPLSFLIPLEYRTRYPSSPFESVKMTSFAYALRFILSPLLMASTEPPFFAIYSSSA